MLKLYVTNLTCFIFNNSISKTCSNHIYHFWHACFCLLYHVRIVYLNFDMHSCIKQANFEHVELHISSFNMFCSHLAHKKSMLKPSFEDCTCFHFKIRQFTRGERLSNRGNLFRASIFVLQDKEKASSRYGATHLVRRQRRLLRSLLVLSPSTSN